ncbi:MAG: gamma-glutamyltransferase [Proteobacteria bacterium]|nr:gamma-glutamyltransferase [Pseudomonadota bacterium]
MVARRQIAILGTALILAACGSDSGDRAVEGAVKGFIGGVATDEPRAALEGRRILSSGGSAADAATAMYFTLAVTLPSAASLGGGGVCLVFQPETKSKKTEKSQVELLEFYAGTPSAIPETATRPSATPGNPIGFFALHSRYGDLPWGTVIANAEKLARFGTQTSRALVRDMAPVGPALLQDQESRRVFGGTDGRPLTEGEFVRQPDLAAILSTIRTRGPGEFYRGNLARTLVSAALAAGGSLSLEDLRRYRPAWKEPVKTELKGIFASNTIYYASAPAAAGIVTAQMVEMVRRKGGFKGADNVERAHLLAETGMIAFSQRAGWMAPDFTSRVATNDLVSSERISALADLIDERRHLLPGNLKPPPVQLPENPSATSFVAIDRRGQAVACALTMNGLFGTGRIARGTGIVLAAAPGGRGPVSLAPMMAINESTSQFLFAGAANGGAAAPTALAAVAARTILAEENLEAAMKAPRVHHGGAPDITFYEPGTSRAVLDGLKARGHRIGATPFLGRVNAASCPAGLPRNSASCSVVTDPRGHGLALSANE